MRHAHILQHVQFEGPGAIGTWLVRHHCQVTTSRFDLGDALPSAAPSTDLLVIMGGPMSVHDTSRHPWLIDEIRFVAQHLERGTPMLGVCLGAQIIARAAGARVYPNPEPEIGWYPIYAVSPPDGSMFRFPAATTVFHWHGETFDLPAGAAHLATSEACRHQAYQLGSTVIGLQFHLETTPDLVEGLVSHGASDLVPSRYVQSAAELRAHDARRYGQLEPLLDSVLTYLTAAGQAGR